MPILEVEYSYFSHFKIYFSCPYPLEMQALILGFCIHMKSVFCILYVKSASHVISSVYNHFVFLRIEALLSNVFYFLFRFVLKLFSIHPTKNLQCYISYNWHNFISKLNQLVSELITIECNIKHCTYIRLCTAYTIVQWWLWIPFL